jgi:branched-chain amino acid transport system ATP-binding protein
VLYVSELVAHYGHVQALRGVSLRVNQGNIVALLGSNGAGKSTTLLNISGLLRPTSGRVTFEGQEIAGRGVETVVRLGITQVLEGRELFRRLTVLENLKMGAYSRNDYHEIRGDMEKVFDYYPILRQRSRQLAGTLSGGEQQMLAIGRALMSRPKLLLLDEPSLGLAPMLVQSIFEIIQRINAEGTTILLVEQNARIALSVASYAYVLELGRVAVEGKGSELLARHEIIASYLGE